MTPAAVERQAGRYLRLFPSWMRADRGEEALGLTLDQLPPGATQLPWSLRLELVRAGLHARRRGTPPPRVWNRLAYTSALRNDPVVPVEWRPWLASVVMTRWITVVYAAIRSAPFLVVAIMQVIVPTSEDPIVPVSFFVMWLGLAVGLWLFRRERWRARVLLVNGFGSDGRPLPTHQMGRSWSQQSVPNTWVVPALLGFVLVGGVYGAVSWFQADRAPGPNILGSGAIVALVVWMCLIGRRRLACLDAGRAGTGFAPKDDRTRNVLAAACGAGTGLLWSWTVALAAQTVGLSLVAALAGPLAAFATLVAVVRVERRIGRRVGEWDLHPAWAPQIVERPIDHLPSPPGGPSTPAMG